MIKIWNMFLTFQKLLKWILWKIIMIYRWLYLNVDVLLLACVFETFREDSMNSFELDTAHYLSAFGYNRDGMLRFIDVDLKLISDFEKYQFIEDTRWHFHNLLRILLKLLINS